MTGDAVFYSYEEFKRYKLQEFINSDGPKNKNYKLFAKSGYSINEDQKIIPACVKLPKFKGWKAFGL